LTVTITPDGRSRCGAATLPSQAPKAKARVARSSLSALTYKSPEAERRKANDQLNGN